MKISALFAALLLALSLTACGKKEEAAAPAADAAAPAAAPAADAAAPAAPAAK
jgi:predicted small lipoprotein YifL